MKTITTDQFANIKSYNNTFLMYGVAVCVLDRDVRGHKKGDKIIIVACNNCSDITVINTNNI